MPKTAQAAVRSTQERAARLIAELSQAVDRAREVLAGARNTRQVTINRRALAKLDTQKNHRRRRPG